MSTTSQRAPKIPPRWIIRSYWSVHRGLYRLSNGRLGLGKPKDNHYGTLHLVTTGRRTGRQHGVIVAYLVDGANLTTLAMNGWADAEPAWWLNLQAQPVARIDLADGSRQVRARAATGDERARLWARWAEVDKGLDQLGARRPSETAVVVLEPMS